MSQIKSDKVASTAVDYDDMDDYDLNEYDHIWRNSWIRCTACHNIAKQNPNYTPGTSKVQAELPSFARTNLQHHHILTWEIPALKRKVEELRSKHNAADGDSSEQTKITKEISKIEGKIKVHTVYLEGTKFFAANDRFSPEFKRVFYRDMILDYITLFMKLFIRPLGYRYLTPLTLMIFIYSILSGFAEIKKEMVTNGA